MIFYFFFNDLGNFWTSSGTFDICLVTLPLIKLASDQIIMKVPTTNFSKFCTELPLFYIAPLEVSVLSVMKSYFGIIHLTHTP